MRETFECRLQKFETDDENECLQTLPDIHRVPDVSLYVFVFPGKWRLRFAAISRLQRKYIPRAFFGDFGTLCI